MVYPQNGDRIVAIDSLTSLHPMYTCRCLLTITWSAVRKTISRAELARVDSCVYSCRCRHCLELHRRRRSSKLGAVAVLGARGRKK